MWKSHSIALAVAWVLATPVQVARAGDAPLRVEILGSGTYVEDKGAPDAQAGTAIGHVTPVKGFRLADPSDKVCARRGVTFGLEYRLVGETAGRLIELTWVTRFPPPGLTNRGGQHFAFNRFPAMAVTGVPLYRSYTFEEDWEIKPGTWTLEFHDKGRKIGEKSFQVIACPAVSFAMPPAARSWPPERRSAEEEAGEVALTGSIHLRDVVRAAVRSAAAPGHRRRPAPRVAAGPCRRPAPPSPTAPW